MIIKNQSLYGLCLVCLGALSACSKTAVPQQTNSGNSILPRMLAQTRTLDSNAFDITVKLDGQNKSYSIVNNNGQFELTLNDRIDNGSYTLAIEIDTYVNAQTRPLYNYSGSLTVSGNGSTTLSGSDFTWPDDDNDGFINFIELDQSSTDLDGDGVSNDLDEDSDGDGIMDVSDATPFSALASPEMISVSAGCNQIGSDVSNADADEIPVHEVCFSAFDLGKYEVTFDQYDTYTDANAYSRVDDQGWGRGSRPVLKVSLDEVYGYIEWLNTHLAKNYRLPTESEWEYSAAAGSVTRYSWGDDIGVNRANCDGCGSEWDSQKTAPVGSFASNSWGLHDMHGNVSEWVEDWYHSSYDGAPDDGSAWVNGDSSLRILRGGAWYSPPALVRSANRIWSRNELLDFSPGFRLAKDQ